MKKAILFSILLILPIFSWAVSTTLVISEFLAQSALGSGDEFIEIRNISASPIDLGDYKIQYYSVNANPGLTINFTAGTMLPAGKTYLLGGVGGTGSSYGPVSDQTFTAGMAVSGQLAILKVSDSSVVDAVAWGLVLTYAAGNTDTTGIFVSPFNSSRERKPTLLNTQDTDNNGNDFLIQTSMNPTALGSPHLSGAFRVPFVPNALQSDVVSAVILAAGGNTITAASVTWSLNTVSQTGILMSSVGSTYSATIPGQADGSIVQYTITGYDNLANSVAASSGYIVGTTLISTIRQNNSNGAPIYENYGARAKGVASVARGESFVNGNIMSIYMQDNSGPLGASGLNVFTRTSTIAVLRGDNLVVEGVITNFNGSLELAVDTVTGPTQGSIANTGSGTEPTPLVIPSALSLNESYEGVLVKIGDCNSGFISAATTASITTTFYRVGNSAQLGTLRILSTANVNIPQNPPTNPVTIIGIVAQSDPTSPYDSGYQLTPRSTTDFIHPVLVVIPESDSYIKLNQVLNLTVTGGTGPYTWSINSTGGATGSLSGVSGNTATFTTGNLVGKVFITVQDSTGNQSSTGLFSVSATAAPLVRDEDAYLIIRKD